MMKYPALALSLIGIVVLASGLMVSLPASGEEAPGSSESKSASELDRPSANKRWSSEKAWQWYNDQDFVFGVNFLPSTAVNFTEMWQAETFDPETIDRELGWAAKIGVNSVRINLQYLVWKDDAQGLFRRMERFLAIADKHGISVTICHFDDCNFAELEPHLGKQRDPIPGVHNSGCTPSPGHTLVTDRKEWPSLERFVHDVIHHFADDQRILMWDLYNEPGNSGMGDETAALLEASFRWARQAKPTQPLTSGAWHHLPDGKYTRIHDAIYRHSDVITFHCYANAEKTAGLIKKLQAHERPMLCTEWMIRPLSAFETHLPIFEETNVGCYSWGLVAGRTQTYYPWGSKPGAPMPKVWFTDLMHKDGRYYDKEEIDVIRRFTAKMQGKKQSLEEGKK